MSVPGATPHSKKNAPKGAQSAAMVDLRGIEPLDLFHAKEGVYGSRGRHQLCRLG